MRVDTNVGINTRYKLQAYKGDTDKLERETDWIPNVVTDIGLDILSVTNRIPNTIFVGDYESTFTEQSEKLGNIVAYTATVRSTTWGVNRDPENFYLWQRVTVRFAVGSINHNLTEAGFGWSASGSFTDANFKEQHRIFSAIRLKNAMGVPTPFPVFADEYLDITIEVRAHYAFQITGSFDLYNAEGQVVDTYNFIGEITCPSTSFANGLTPITIPRINYYAGSSLFEAVANPNFGDSTKAITGGTRYGDFNQWSSGYTQSTEHSYPGPRTHKAVTTFRLDNSMNTRNIKYLLIRIDGTIDKHYTLSDALGYKIELDHTITKTAEQTLIMENYLTWDRKYDT